MTTATTTTQPSAAATAAPAAAPAQGYRVIGSRPVRHDGADKVTGRARYGADLSLPGMLHGKILRSPHAHARIKSIDVSRALAMPGVHAVATAADFPQPAGRVLDLGEGAMINPKFLSNNCLAAEKALYKGHAIAAVAADSPHEAELALALIEVEYEVLPPVTDVLEAMRADAPLLHERLANLNDPTVRPGGLLAEGDAGKTGNVPNRYSYEIGDLDAGFAAADVIVAREFRTKAVHQGYIEPHAATALWDPDGWNPDGALHLWCSSQGHFNVRDQTATILGIPVSRILVTQLEIGGGFGGKTLVYLEPVAAVLSRKTGRPVKIQMSRAEVFEGTGPTSGGYLRVKMGATNDGRITAADVTLFYEAGAYPGSPVNPGAQCALSCYNIPNGRIEAADVVLNHPKTAAYRAPGSPAATFAVESVVDEICATIGMDKLEFRVRNGARTGDRRVTGPQFGSIGWQETLQAAREHDHWNAPIDRAPETAGKKVGRGVAGGFWFNGTGPASAIVSVLADGAVSLVEGSPDIGGSRAVAAMHVAEVLGIAAEDVNPSVGDTNSIGWTSMTGGSGVAFKTGWASYEAAQDVKRQLVERAARIWDIDPANVEYAAGVIQHKSEPELRFTFRQLAARLNATGGPIVGRANVSPTGVGGAYALHIADVAVDEDTGKVDILRYTAVQDVGAAIHPSYVEGQIQGGAVQGIGWALNEEYYFNDAAQLQNSSFLDYRMPTSLDLPMIDTVVVEVPNPGHPYGVRGVGEVPIVPPMAAIANAIHDATGVRMTSLPMNPGAVLEALWAQNGG